MGATPRAEQILAGAITLRDSSGRDRKEALRSMAAAWNVSRRIKVEDRWKDRSGLELSKDLEAAVCDAALKWESDTNLDVPLNTDAVSSSSVDDGRAVKIAKTIDAAEHLAVSAKHTGGTTRELPETPNDITSLE